MSHKVSCPEQSLCDKQNMMIMNKIENCKPTFFFIKTKINEHKKNNQDNESNDANDYNDYCLFLFCLS